jgi:hypothetical protein
MRALRGALRDANLRSEREQCEFLPDVQGRPNRDRSAEGYIASPDAREGAGTEMAAAASGVTNTTCFTETRERRPLLLESAGAAGHAVTLAESRKTSASLR